MYVGQEDPSQVFALASVWILFLVFGCSACLVPVVYTIIEGHKDSLDMGYLYGGKTSSLEFLAMVNGMLFMALGSLIGYPIALASGTNLFMFLNISFNHV